MAGGTRAAVRAAERPPAPAVAMSVYAQRRTYALCRALAKGRGHVTSPRPGLVVGDAANPRAPAFRNSWCRLGRLHSSTRIELLGVDEAPDGGLQPLVFFAVRAWSASPVGRAARRTAPARTARASASRRVASTKASTARVSARVDHAVVQQRPLVVKARPGVQLCTISAFCAASGFVHHGAAALRQPLARRCPASSRAPARRPSPPCALGQELARPEAAAAHAGSYRRRSWRRINVTCGTLALPSAWIILLPCPIMLAPSDALPTIAGGVLQVDTMGVPAWSHSWMNWLALVAPARSMAVVGDEADRMAVDAAMVATRWPGRSRALKSSQAESSTTRAR